MRPLAVAVSTFMALSVGVLGSASAQQADAEVLVVDLDTFDVSDAVMEDFYDHVGDVIADEEAMSVGDAGDVSIDELQLMAGCGSIDPDCLAVIGDLVTEDRILFGSVERSQDVHMFTMTLFDFEQGETVGEVSEQTLRGDRDWLHEGMPAVVEHLIHGRTATLDIQVEGAPDADVQVNGETVGTGTTTVDEVAPGEVVVAVSAEDEDPRQERLIVRHNEQRQVDFEFERPVAELDDEPDTDDAPSLAPGMAAGGLGVAGLIVGIVGQSQLAAADARAETLIDGRSAVSEDDHQQLVELEGDMTRANTMRWVGFGVGTVGLVGGGYLLIRALTAEPAAQTAGQADGIQLDIGAGHHGMNAGFRLTF